jgi:diguanylate cyclase (GGDEF)-like protein
MALASQRRWRVLRQAAALQIRVPALGHALRVRSTMLAVWLALSVVLAATCRVALQGMEQTELDRIAERAATGVEVAAQTVQRTLEAAMALHALVQQQVLATARGETSEASVRYLTDLARFERLGIVQISSIAPDGWLSWSTVPNWKPVDLSGRKHFLAHAVAGSRRVEVSEPLIGRTSGRWSLQVTQSLHDAAGRFGGVAVVSVDPVLLSTELLLQLNSEGTTAALRRVQDGTVVAISRNPAGRLTHEESYQHPLAVAARLASEGGLRFRRTADGRRMSAYFRVLPGFDLIVEVSKDEAVELAGFRLLSSIIWTAMALSMVASLGGGELLLRIHRLRRSLEHQATRDPLTGLYNRRFLSEAVRLETARAQRTQSCFSVVLADLDHFKRLNDSLGHAAGDAALRDVADCLMAMFRGSDIVCRYGGEELLVLLPGSGLEGACRSAEALRGEIGRLRDGSEAELPALSVSVGVATFPLHGASGEAIIQAADAALYQAKQAGRDRVRSANIAAGGGGDAEPRPSHRPAAGRMQQFPA